MVFAEPGPRKLEEFVARLGVYEEGARPIIEDLPSRLDALFERHGAAAYTVEATDDGYAAGTVAGLGARGLAIARRHIHGQGGPHGLYNALRPEPTQRNKSMILCTNDDGDVWFRGGMKPPQPSPLSRELLLQLGLRHQLRVLLCDGPVLLAWAGFVSATPFSNGERRLLARISAPLRRRLASERRFEIATLYQTALATSLEAFPGAAFVVTMHGSVRHANSAGVSLLANEGRAARSLLASLARRRATDPRFACSWFKPRGMAEHCLVLAGPSVSPRARVQRAGSQWRLTPRELDVLAPLTRGEPNKTIAALLDCAERTIEVHVSSILAKADVESRAALVARFWTLGD